MPIPIVHFEYSVSGLQVSFTDTSTNVPTSWLWDFGDSNTSTDRNPTHIYAGEGTYTVTLVSTNGDGAGTIFTTVIDVLQSEQTFSPINTPIMQIVDFNIPTALTGEATVAEKNYLITKWQLYLQPLVEVPTTVDISDTHNESAWPMLVNSLIGQLCAMDIILQGANQYLSAAGSAGGSTSTSTTGDEGDGDTQQIKSIKTGPAEVEYYENDQLATTSEIINNIGEAYSSATKAGGALDQLKQSICQLAHRLRINLPQICEALPHSPTNFVIAKPCLNTYKTDPYSNGISK